MESHGAPWIEVPDGWLDSEYSSDPEIARLQQFLKRKVKAGVVRRYMLADGIGGPGELEIENIRVVVDDNRCRIVAVYNVTGQAWKVRDEASGLFVDNKDRSIIKSDKADITRVIKKNNDGNIQSITFSVMGVGKAKLPDDFANEYYKRVIPFLQKIDVKYIETVATTEANDPNRERGRLIGAYVWPKYGYTNGVMNKETGQVEVRISNTIDEFLKYLKDDRKLKLKDKEIDAIKNIDRMRELAKHKIERKGNKLEVGKDFLLGDDGTGKYSRDVIWQGIIPDINNETSDEMKELKERLGNPKRK